MSERSLPDPKNVAQTQAKLRELAAEMRDGVHLDSGTRQAMADLLDELGTVLGADGSASDKTVHLAEAVHEVAHSLHEKRPAGLITTARDRLQEAATRVELEAPVMTNVVTRLMDLLANMGI